MKNKISIIVAVVSLLILAVIPHAFGVTDSDGNAIKEKDVVISDSDAISIFEKTVGITKNDKEKENVIKGFYIIRPSLKDTASGKRLSSTLNKAAIQSNKFEDGTPYIIDLMQVAERLDNATKSQVISMVSVTASSLSETKSTTHFDIHYTLDPASTDQTTIPFVDEMADYFEKSYQTEINDWGYREGDSGVFSSKYQVYIKNIPSPGGGTILGVTKPTLLLDGTTIEINNQISGFDDGEKLGTAAHEYYHASQNSYIFIYALLSKDWVIEGSAAWMEHEVFRNYFPGDVTDGDFSIFTSRMNEYLNAPNLDIADLREDLGYPSGQYFYFLADNNKINFNGVGIQRTVNRKVWEELSSHSWVGVNGAFDDALSSAPSEYNSFDKSFKPFTKANYFKTIWYPSEIIYITDVSRNIVDLTSVQSVTETSGIGGVLPVEHYAADYFKIQAPSSSYVKINFKANDKDANFYIRVYSEGDENSESTISLTDGKGTLTTKAENTAIIVGRLNDGGILGTPNGNFEITIERIPPIDLIFVIDTTGSMYDDIASVKSSASDIVNALDSKTNDYRVAVVDYRDYPQSPYGQPGLDYVYKLDLPFSNDKNTIVNSINSLSLGYGMDWQESVYSALVKTMTDSNKDPSNASNYGWRKNVTKTIILMGDAPPHDPEPWPGSNTLSDVTYWSQNIDPVIVYSVVIGYDSTTFKAFSEISEKTGGKVYTSPTASDIVDTIIEVIGDIGSTPTNRGVTLNINPKINVSNPGGSATYSINVTNTGTIADTYNISIDSSNFAGTYRGYPTAIQTSWINLQKTSVKIEPGALETVSLTISVPNNWAGMDDIIYPFNVTAKSATDDSIGNTSSAELKIIANKRSKVEYSKLETIWLSELIQSSSINNEIKNSLLDKLTNATLKLDQAILNIESRNNKQANNMLSASQNIINAFINQVEAQYDKKIMQPDAEMLKQKAIVILQDVESAKNV